MIFGWIGPNKDIPFFFFLLLWLGNTKLKKISISTDRPRKKKTRKKKKTRIDEKYKFWWKISKITISTSQFFFLKTDFSRLIFSDFTKIFNFLVFIFPCFFFSCHFVKNSCFFFSLFFFFHEFWSKTTDRPIWVYQEKIKQDTFGYKI